MLFTAIGFFALAALLGLVLLSYVLRSKETPKGIAFIHGPLAATGIVILIIYAIYNPLAPTLSLCLFILAALGGFIMISRDILGKSVPKWMAVGHGLVAITAFILLLFFAFHLSAT